MLSHQQFKTAGSHAAAVLHIKTPKSNSSQLPAMMAAFSLLKSSLVDQTFKRIQVSPLNQRHRF
jgi:hypothetical protein